MSTRFKYDLGCMSHTSATPARSTYGPLIPFYASMARCYSGGAIPACQRWAVQRLPAGSRVLFAGAGPGTDLTWAAQASPSVTAVDSCGTMIQHARRRLHRAGVDDAVDLVHADLFQLPKTASYDAVVAQFFLNVFAPTQLPHVLDNLADHLKPRGRLIVGDFAPLSRGRHVLQQAYHDLPMRFFAHFGANAIHAVHDLPGHLAAAGFLVSERRRFGLFGVGPRWIEGLVAARKPEPS